MGTDARQRPGRRWPMVVGLAALALMLPAGDATAAEVLDANCPGPATRPAYSSRGGGQYEAQTFRVLHTGMLTRVAVQVNNDSGNTDFALGISAIDANGTPVGGALSSATIAGASVPPGPATLDASLSPALQVKAGQAYALVITRGAGVLTSFSFPAIDGNCIGDTFYNDGQDQPWNLDVPGVDLLYQTFVEPDPGAKQGGQSGNDARAFNLVNKKGRLFARVPGPGRLVVNDGKKPAQSSRAGKHRARNLVKRTKAVAKKAGDVPLRIELTNRAIRRVLRTHKLKTWGGVTYTPKGGEPSTIVFRIRLRV